MKEQIDRKIIEKFVKDTYIPENINLRINKIIEEQRNVNFNKNENTSSNKIKNAFFKRKLLTSLSIVLVTIFLGINMYAYAVGKNNIFSNLIQKLNISNIKYEKIYAHLIENNSIFSVLTQKLNINNIEYEEQKVVLKEDSNKKLDLLEYAYNDEVLILNYVYNGKENIKNYKDITTDEDFTKFGIYEENAEYPSFIIADRIQKISPGKYGIFKVLDMNYLKKKNGKIKIYVKSVSGPKYEDKVKKEFILDVSKKNKNEKVYKFKNNILKFNIKKLKQKVDVVTEEDLDEASLEYFSEKAQKDKKLRDKIYKENFKNKVKMTITNGIQGIEIERIVNTNFCALIYLNSYISLQKIGREDDMYLNEYCPGYTFEITNKKGEVLCTRDSENLQLDPESGIGSGILMINSISNSDKTINIKVYEEITGGLISERVVYLK